MRLNDWKRQAEEYRDVDKAAHEEAKKTMWRVERHGGRDRGRGSSWRVIANGDEATCREVFDNVKRDLRQGGLRLFNPDNVCLDEAVAPRLRTRW